MCTRCRGPALAPAWQPGCGGWVWRCGGCGFVANTAKVAALLARLEQEVRMLEGMEEATTAQVRAKAASYQSFLDKKAKLLPPNSYLLLNAAASLCLLLARLRPDPEVLGVRESWTRRRLRAMEMVEGGSRSRLRGFDLFRLYQILEQRASVTGDRGNCDRVWWWIVITRRVQVRSAARRPRCWWRLTSCWARTPPARPRCWPPTPGSWTPWAPRP